MQLIRVVILLILLMLVAESKANATNYYVSTTGNDSNACTAIDSSACATINGAIGKATTGDTIYIQSGTYDMDDESGNCAIISKDVTVTAYDQNNMPILQGLQGQSHAVRLTASGATLSYVKVYFGASRCGNSCWDTISIEAENTIVDHCEARYGFNGIGIENVRRNIQITNNTCYQNGSTINPPASPEDGNGHGIVLNDLGSGTDPTSWSEKILVSGNTCYENYGDGIQLGNDTVAKYVEITSNTFRDNYEDGIDLKGCQYVTIHSNTLSSNDGDGIVTHRQTPIDPDDIDFYNNIVADNGWWGIYVGQYTERFHAWNNLIYGNGTDDSTYATYGIAAISTGTVDITFFHNVINANDDGVNITTNTTFKNNSVWNNTGTNCSMGSATVDYNHFYPSCSDTNGTHAITDADPLFVDYSSHDYNIKASSGLNDSGIYDSNYATDKDGVTRHNGTYIGCDIGAYEYQAPISITVNHTNWDVSQSASDDTLATVTDNKTILWGHKSCGYDIVGDRVAGGGWKNLASKYQMTTFESTSTDWDTDTTNLTNGMLYHGDVYDNEYATCKTKHMIDKLADTQANSRTYAQDTDVALVKFCFTDLDSNCREDYDDYAGSIGTQCDASGYQTCTAAGVFASYIEQMEAAIDAYPAINFIFVSTKLKTECASGYMYNDAVKRNDFNVRLREYIEANGGIFWDLGDIDSYGSAGSQSTCSAGGDAVPIFHTDWADADTGHYNQAGSFHQAYALISVLTELYGESGTSSPTISGVTGLGVTIQ